MACSLGHCYESELLGGFLRSFCSARLFGSAHQSRPYKGKTKPSNFWSITKKKVWDDSHLKGLEMPPESNQMLWACVSAGGNFGWFEADRASQKTIEKTVFRSSLESLCSRLSILSSLASSWSRSLVLVTSKKKTAGRSSHVTHEVNKVIRLLLVVLCVFNFWLLRSRCLLATTLHLHPRVSVPIPPGALICGLTWWVTRTWKRWHSEGQTPHCAICTTQVSHEAPWG